MSIKKPSLECPKCKKQPNIVGADGLARTVVCSHCGASIKNPSMRIRGLWQRLRLYEIHRRSRTLSTYASHVTSVDQNGTAYHGAVAQAPEVFLLCRDVLVNFTPPAPVIDGSSTYAAKYAAEMAKTQYERLLAGRDIVDLPKRYIIESKWSPSDWARFWWTTILGFIAVCGVIEGLIVFQLSAMAGSLRSELRDEIALAARVEAMSNAGHELTVRNQVKTKKPDDEETRKPDPAREVPEKVQREPSANEGAAKSEADSGSE